MATSAKPSTAARSMLRASRASRDFEGFGAQPGGGPGGGAHFEGFSFGPDGFRRSGGGGGGAGFEELLRGMFGGRAGAARQHFETEDFGRSDRCRAGPARVPDDHAC